MGALVPSQFQTKTWRLSQAWYTNGRRTECEKYQFRLIQDLFDIKLEKTRLRLHLSLFEFAEYNVYDWKFDYSETFDAMCVFQNITIFFNFKFICEEGGMQTSRLRDAYQFINAQIHSLRTLNKTMFVNILDGAESHRQMGRFRHLKELTNAVDDFLFIGDLYTFSDWFPNRFNLYSSDLYAIAAGQGSSKYNPIIVD